MPLSSIPRAQHMLYRLLSAWLLCNELKCCWQWWQIIKCTLGSNRFSEGFSICLFGEELVLWAQLRIIFRLWRTGCTKWVFKRVPFVTWRDIWMGVWRVLGSALDVKSVCDRMTPKIGQLGCLCHQLSSVLHANSKNAICSRCYKISVKSSKIDDHQRLLCSGRRSVLVDGNSCWSKLVFRKGCVSELLI